MTNTPVEENRIKRVILIVEDNEINREMLKEILSDTYTVIEAVDGKDGLERLRQNYRNLSLVLLDVRMPNMNGFEFLEVYKNDKILSSVPVIVTTGSTITEDEERCLALGASDFVTKPYNPKIIIRRIEAIIRLHESIATLNAVKYDAISGLYTKNAFHHHTQNLLDHAESEKFDMLMLNIEDFSYFNERYGESVGNKLLEYIGKYMLSEDANSIFSCRYHADRFVLIRNHTEVNHIKEAARFDKTIKQNAPIKDFTLKYAVYENVPKDTSVGVLCDRLSLSISTIKHQYNKQVAFYDKTISEQLNRRRKIAECMEESLSDGQFKVYYQPKHDAATGCIAGAEALVRWFHPTYGLLSPGEFIPIFEETGFITVLDKYIWETVCRNLKIWREQNIPLIPISVNASRKDFVTIDSADEILQPLEENGIDRNLMHIEITESLGIGDEFVLQKAKEIRDNGIKIELDDFGSGHSSLGTIRDIPMDIIKLDISFVRALHEQKEIVKMIISLAHALGHKAVAEGVETEEQFEILKEYGCDLVQGYYFSKPLPEEEFTEYLKKAKCVIKDDEV